MLAFPFDSEMTIEENPITQELETVFDRAVSSQPLRHLLRKLFTTGIMPDISDNYLVSAGTDGMTIVVHSGFAVVDGGLALETEDRTLEVTAAHATLDRIDTVVLRWNENVDVRTCDLYVVQGTPAATPVRPELQRDNSIYEIGLADIFVTRSVVTITNEKITDTRYEAERCGVVRSISEYDTTYIYQQVQADLAGFKNGEETAFSTWSTEQKAAFEAWFATIQDILDENTAGHLQNEIDTLTAKVVAEPATSDRFELFDTFEGSALAHTIYGMSKQDGIPTPTNPVDIVDAKANFKCVGKNLINATLTSRTANGITITKNVDGTYIVNGTATNDTHLFIENIKSVAESGLTNGSDYRLCGCPSGGSLDAYYIVLYTYDENNNVISGYADGGSGTTRTLANSAVNVRPAIVIKTGTTLNNALFKPMLTLDLDATYNDYEPYHEYEADTDLVLRAIEVSSTDDYNLVKDGKYYVADTIEWSEDEGYKLIRRIASVDLGDKTWAYQTQNTYFYATFDNVKKSDFTKIIEMCDGFVGSIMPMANMPMGSVRLRETNSNMFNFKYDGTTDPTAFKTLVTGMKLQYIMETPTVTYLSRSQAKTLLSLQTYNDTTLIESTADVAPVVKLEYGRTQNEAYALTGHNQAKSGKLNLTANDGLEFQFASSNGEHGYLDENGVFKAFKTTHTLTKILNAIGTMDMGEDHKYRYVETEGLMAIPTATKTITANGNNIDVTDFAKVNVSTNAVTGANIAYQGPVNDNGYGQAITYSFTASSAGIYVMVAMTSTGNSTSVNAPNGITSTGTLLGQAQGTTAGSSRRVYMRLGVAKLAAGQSMSCSIPSPAGDGTWQNRTAFAWKIG